MIGFIICISLLLMKMGFTLICIYACVCLCFFMEHEIVFTHIIAIFFRFCNHPDDKKRAKVAMILDKLITLTIEEVEMYPSIQAKIWGNIGQVSHVLFNVLLLWQKSLELSC